MKHEHDQKLYCMICRKEIPAERAIKRSNTCTNACRDKLKSLRRYWVTLRHCQICAKPSTPEQRRLYKEWQRSRPEFMNRKRGRKAKGAAA